MTSCSVSPERHSTTLYSSDNGLDWCFEDIVLDHQNKDMLIFEGCIGGHYWAQTRPLGDLYFAYPPGSEWRAGPSINLATSPDARSEEHTFELQSLMRISYAVFCLKNKNTNNNHKH